MNEAALFVSTYVLVLALGLQSLNVNGGHYAGAFFTSIAISGSQLVLYKLAPDASHLEILAFMSGGPLGIISAMWLHPRLVAWRERMRQRASTRDDPRRAWHAIAELGLGDAELTYGSLEAFHHIAAALNRVQHGAEKMRLVGAIMGRDAQKLLDYAAAADYHDKDSIPVEVFDAAYIPFLERWCRGFLRRSL
jgi:hypothetical protein